MTKQDGIRLVTELEAERILLARGFTKEPCKACEGRGHFMVGGTEDWNKFACDRCDGATWIWKEPA